MAAFVYRAESADAAASDRGWNFYDALTNQAQDQIPPHQSVTLIYSGHVDAGLLVKISVAAGVFADGSSFGDPAMVSRIVERRKYLLAAIDAVTADLNREMQEGKRKDDVIADLEASLNRAMQGAADQDQRAFFQSLYQPAIRAVRDTLRDAPMPILPYQAMQRQISSLTIQRNLLAGATAAGR